MDSSRPPQARPTSESRPDSQPSPSAEPGRSEGMPAKTPSAGSSRPGRNLTPQDASDESSLALPHERDQSNNMTATQPDPQIQQAARDLKRNLQDTSKSAAMDGAYRKLKGG